MRVLFDENLNQRLRRFFGERFEVITVTERSWTGKSNGELLRLAQEEFDVLLTTDKGIPHQQTLSRFDLAVVILEARSNSYEDLEPLMDRAIAALGSARTGEAISVPA